jgi:predicted AlkP superfamily phosphohydrolase/phosphomutase
MSRTVLIGLDGATFTILDPLMEGGVMPFLKEFVARGVRAELLSTPLPVTAQAWPSLMTGRSPGYHGVFDFVRLEQRPHGAYFTISNSRDLRCETVWSIASRQNRTVTSLNFYGMFPPQDVAGHMISGFVPWRHLKNAVHPPGLYEKLLTLPKFNRKELSMDMSLEKQCIQGMPPDQYEDWLALHMRREEQWFEVLRYLMINEPSDLTAIVFDGVDKLQHLCWRFIDPALFPKSPSKWEQRVHDLCLEYFRRIDGYIADIVSLAGPDAQVFMASDHGFGPTTEIFYVNVWLHQNGYLEWTDQTETDDMERLTADRLKNHVTLVDWAGTSAYAVTPSSNGIYIPVAGNGSPHGIASGKYEGFRKRLTESLLSFTDPANGEPVVTRVRTREEAYPGTQMHLAPDLLLTLRDGGFVSILNADAPLKPRSEPAGTHRPEGIFMANGPGIKEGFDAARLSILDVAPTLLYSLGLPLTDDLEGQLPTAIFESSFLQAMPARYVEIAHTNGSSQGRDSGVTEDAVDDVDIMERLRALGYLE